MAKLTKDDLIGELLSRNHSLKQMSSFNKAELLEKLRTIFRGRDITIFVEPIVQYIPIPDSEWMKNLNKLRTHNKPILKAELEHRNIAFDTNATKAVMLAALQEYFANITAN